MFVFVGSMILAQLLGTFVPGFGVYFLGLAGLAFAFAFFVFFIAMVSTPYRFGELFEMLSRDRNT